MKQQCPFCSEEINHDAVKCRHCGEILDKQKAKEIKSKLQAQQISKTRKEQYAELKKIYTPKFLIKFVLLPIIIFIISFVAYNVYRGAYDWTWTYFSKVEFDGIEETGYYKDTKFGIHRIKIFSFKPDVLKSTIKEHGENQQLGRSINISKILRSHSSHLSFYYVEGSKIPNLENKIPIMRGYTGMGRGNVREFIIEYYPDFKYVLQRNFDGSYYFVDCEENPLDALCRTSHSWLHDDSF